MSVRGKTPGNRPQSTGRYRPNSQARPQSQAKNANQNGRKVVGHYLLGKTIGEGTFGKVKIAVHIPTGEKVAVKILEKSRIKDQADVRRVNREIKILKRARHANIIQLYEVIDTASAIYLIMENADGGEMFDYIVSHRYVPERQACKFLHQILNGLEVLHQHEITHRDLKPENLLLKASGSGWIVKIVDFGLSNTHDGGKLLSTACGSPCYAAPEMIAGKQYKGPMADIWSLGVILFALVSGYLPFEDPNTSVLYRKILSGEYKTPKWLSAEVKDLLTKILEVDPAKRYTIAQIRQHPWYRMVSEASVPSDTIYSEEESATLHNEIIRTIATTGLDPQVVLDALPSRACNSHTAMYYLLEQKLKTLRKQQKELVISSTNKSLSSNRSHPETSSDHAGDTPNPAIAAATAAATKPIPKLNIKPDYANLVIEGPLTSQTARPQSNAANKEKPQQPLSARPVVDKHKYIEVVETLTPVARPPPELNIIVADVNRPDTRRSKSRQRREEESNTIEQDMGMDAPTASILTTSTTTTTAAVTAPNVEPLPPNNLQPAPPTSMQPSQPSQPKPSAPVATRAPQRPKSSGYGGRRGKNIANQILAAELNETRPTVPALAAPVTPSKPQNNAPKIQSPRELAAKNKLAAQGTLAIYTQTPTKPLS